MSPHTGELLVREIAPRIRSSLPSHAAIGSEDAQELAQDAIAMAASLLISAEARGKKVTPGNIAYYAVRLVRQGRRSTGQRKTDPLHAAAQLSGRAAVVSLDAVLTNEAEGEEPMCLHDVLAARIEDPAASASRRLDWEDVMASLDRVARAVLSCLVNGEELTSLVAKLRRSRSALQSDKRRLARLVREHLGEDVLQRVQERPGWMNNLQANREKVACRLERQVPT